MSMNRQQLLAVREAAELIYSQSDVDAALDAMARSIEAEMDDRDPLMLCVMTGGLITTSELFTRLACPVQLDYLHATRYVANKGGSKLQWITRPSQPLAGRTVLVVDDILDEGLTLAAILEYCHEEGARAVYSAVLVEKLHQRKLDNLRPDFVGLEVEDRYVFGCGMDYHGYWRNLKGIYAVKEN